MNDEQLIRSLEAFPAALHGAVACLSHDDATWRPPDGAWSVLEIVAHLADEEDVDFRTRVRMTLEDPSRNWPGIDPEARVTDLNMIAGSLHDSFEQFRRERARSVEWLRSLDRPDWSMVYHHRKLGSITAGDLLAAWTAHDWFHLRQIAKRRVQMIAAAAKPYEIAYAGGTL